MNDKTINHRDTETQRKSRREKSFLSLLPALLALTLPLPICSGARAQDAPPAPVVSVFELAARDFPYRLEFVGRVEGTQGVQVRAQTDGILLARRYSEGSWVNKGDVLFELDDSAHRSRFKLAQARQRQAEAAKVRAERNYARAVELKKLNSISEKEYDAAYAAHVSAEAEVSGAKAALENARIELEKTRIRAPIGGYADMARLQEGALVVAQSPEEGLLTTINDTRKVQVIFHVPAARVRTLQQLARQEIGVFREPVVVSILTDGDIPYPHQGVLRFGSGVVNPESGSMISRAEFPNPDSELAVGQLVRVRLAPLVFPQSLMLPQSAVFYAQGAATVAVVDGEGAVSFVPLRARGPFNGQFLLDAAGELKAGMRVVVEGVNKIGPGMRVRTTPFPAG
jgi:membrane fusion protein (multidrug efflux system)